MTHVCVSKIVIIGSDNGLLPDRRQAIIWTNAGILLITWDLRMNFGEMLIEINTSPFKKMHLKMSSANWHLFLLGLNVLTNGFVSFLLRAALLVWAFPWITIKKIQGFFFYNLGKNKWHLTISCLLKNIFNHYSHVRNILRQMELSFWWNFRYWLH